MNLVAFIGSRPSVTRDKYPVAISAYYGISCQPTGGSTHDTRFLFSLLCERSAKLDIHGRHILLDNDRI